MNRTKIFLLTAIVLSITTTAIVSSKIRKEKIQLLNNISNFLQYQVKSSTQAGNYFKDSDKLPNTLSQLALDSNEQISARALYVINLLALVSRSHSRPDSNLPNLSQSAEVRDALTRLIKDNSRDDEIRASAIEAYSWMYPPDESIIREFNNIVVAAGIRRGKLLSAIFTAFSKYKRLYNYDMPASSIEAAEKLIDHPSETVRIKAFSVLAENVGKPALPIFFHELETTRGIGLVDILIKNILHIDSSEETVHRLREIAAKFPDEDTKVQLINDATNPENLARYREANPKIP